MTLTLEAIHDIRRRAEAVTAYTTPDGIADEVEITVDTIRTLNGDYARPDVLYAAAAQLHAAATALADLAIEEATK